MGESNTHTPPADAPAGGPFVVVLDKDGERWFGAGVIHPSGRVSSWSRRRARALEIGADRAAAVTEFYRKPGVVDGTVSVHPADADLV